MELYKRGDGRSPFWHVDLVDGVTGNRVRKSTGQVDKRAAHRVAREMAAKIASAVRETTVGAALDAYIEQMVSDGLKSHTDARIKANKTVGLIADTTRFRLDPNLTLSRLTPTLVQALKTARAREGNQPGTIAAELRILRAACRLAEDQGFVAAAVRKWGVPPPVRRLRYLSAAEAEVVLAYLRPTTEQGIQLTYAQDVHDLFLALVLTGGRWNEIATMTWRQINRVDQTVTLFGWKGAKERTVPLVPEVYDMLVRREAGQTKRSPYAFPGKDGKARFGPCRAIARALDRVGLNDAATVEAFGRATIHALRHTYASWLRQRGLGLDEIQPLLGHADLATTKIYAKVVQASTLNKAREALMGQRANPEDAE